MSRRKKALLVGVLVSMVLAVLLLRAHEHAGDAVSVEFICLTNGPGGMPSALLVVTNHALSLMVCAKLPPQVRVSSGWSSVNKNSPSGLAYLELGESYPFTVPIPEGSGPWRALVLWQRQDLSTFDEFMNRMRDRWQGRHPDAWFPLKRVSYSPEISRGPESRTNRVSE